jgi:hypothetical protein
MEKVMADIKCKKCGFVAFDEIPEIAKAKAQKCIMCGNLLIEDIDDSFFVSCSNCNKNISKDAIECPKCGWKRTLLCRVCSEKIPFNSIICPECGDPKPFAESAGSKFTINSKLENPSKRWNKNIRVLRPAITGGLLFLALTVATDKTPLEYEATLMNFINSLSKGVVAFLVVFLIVAIWQGIRGIASANKPDNNTKKTKTDQINSKAVLFRSIVTHIDADAVINGCGLLIVLLAGLGLAMSSQQGDVIFNSILMISLVFIIYYYKSNLASICLLSLCVLNAIMIGFNRFSGEEGNKNLLFAILIFWASTRILQATLRLRLK